MCIGTLVLSAGSNVVAQNREAEASLELAVTLLTGFPFGDDERPDVLLNQFRQAWIRRLSFPKPCAW